MIVSVDNFASLKDSLFPIFVSGVELTCIFVCHCLKYISSCLYASRSDISCNVSASLLQALEKQQESLLHFREAVKLAPWNFEAQKGISLHGFLPLKL